MENAAPHGEKLRKLAPPARILKQIFLLLYLMMHQSENFASCKLSSLLASAKLSRDNQKIMQCNA
jgi:hypothetical protein